MKNIKSFVKFNEDMDMDFDPSDSAYYTQLPSNHNIDEIIGMIDEKLDELVGSGEYDINYHDDTDRIYVVFKREGGGESECLDMANIVIDYIETELNIKMRIGNHSSMMFWLTF